MLRVSGSRRVVVLSRECDVNLNQARSLYERTRYSTRMYPLTRHAFHVRLRFDPAPQIAQMPYVQYCTSEVIRKFEVVMFWRPTGLMQE